MHNIALLTRLDDHGRSGNCVQVLRTEHIVLSPQIMALNALYVI